MNSVTDSAKVAIKSEESTPRRGYIFNNRAIFPIPTHTIGSALGLGCKIQATKVQKHPPTHACLALRRLSHRKSYHTIHATALTCAQHSVPTTQTSPHRTLAFPPETAAEFPDSAALSAGSTEDSRNMYGATRSRSAAHGGKMF